MVEEIIYTSAEKGLKQGSRGFCTVVSTTGMALNLAERLESMSGYRQAFPLHDPKASLNPVCWSHMTTRLAGRSLHVISRVADAGQDYTGRSNKLAHHLVIDNVASLISGPARMLAETGVVTDRWDGTVRHVPPRDLRSASMPATIPLVAWKALTGDEGWAGAVAEQLLQSPAPVSIIFDPGTDTLTLVREVLDLIPAAQRWNVTFSTYFTRLLAGAECQLRFVLNDTPEATSLRNDARARVVNLTSPLPAATGGTLVAMARQGQLTPLEIAPPQPTTAARPRASVETSTKDTPKDTAAEISIPKLKPGLSPVEPTDRPHSPPEFGAAQVRGSKKGVWIAVALALMFVIGTGSLFLLRDRNAADPFSDLVSKTVPQDQPPTQAEKEATGAREQAEKDSRDQKERERQKNLAAEEAMKKAESDSKLAETKMAAEQEAQRIRQEATDAQAKADRDKMLKEDGPFAFIKGNTLFRDKYNQWLFSLPKPGEVYLVGHEHNWPQLRANGGPIVLSLCEEAALLFEGCPYKLSLSQDPVLLNEWTVQATSAGNMIPIAKYTLKEVPRDAANSTQPDTELQFEWLRDASRETVASELLRWWPLKIQVHDRTAVFLQRTAEIPSTHEGRPTWKNLVESKRIEVINTDAIKAIEFDKVSTAKFTIDIAQPDKGDQKLELPIVPETSDDNAQTSALPAKKLTTSKFFHLTPPFELIDNRPEITDAMVGFGELQLTVSQTTSKGLILNPLVTVTLRLAKKEYLKILPDFSTNSGLTTIQKTPAALAKWNPALADELITNLQNTLVELRSDPEKWHTQALKPLPAKENFESDLFYRLVKNATKSVRAHESNCRIAVQRATVAVNQLNNVTETAQRQKAQMELPKAQNKLKQAEDALKFATSEVNPRILPFTAAMERMTQEMTKTNAELVKDYETIDGKIGACLTAMEKVDVRCSLSAQVSTAVFDSGEGVCIYFVETTSPNWPANETPQEQK